MYDIVREFASVYACLFVYVFAWMSLYVCVCMCMCASAHKSVAYLCLNVCACIGLRVYNLCAGTWCVNMLIFAREFIYGLCVCMLACVLVRDIYVYI